MITKNVTTYTNKMHFQIAAYLCIDIRKKKFAKHLVKFWSQILKLIKSSWKLELYYIMIRNRFTSLIFWNSNNLKNLQSPANITFDITFWPSYVRSSYRSGSGAIADEKGKITAVDISNTGETPNSYRRRSSGRLREREGGGQVEASFLIPFHYQYIDECVHTRVHTRASQCTRTRAVPENALFIRPPFFPASSPTLISHIHLSLSLSLSFRLSLKTWFWFILDWPRAHLLLSAIFSKCSPCEEAGRVIFGNPTDDNQSRIHSPEATVRLVSDRERN